VQYTPKTFIYGTVCLNYRLEAGKFSNQNPWWALL